MDNILICRPYWCLGYCKIIVFDDSVWLEDYDSEWEAVEAEYENEDVIDCL